MKNCNEIVNDLLERKDAYTKMKLQKRRTAAKTIASVSVFCLVLLLGTVIWKNGILTSQPPADKGSGNMLDGNSYSPGGIATSDGIEISEKNPLSPETTQPGNTSQMVVNSLDQPPVSSDMDVEYNFYDKIPENVWQEIVSEFHSFTGIEFEEFLSRIPADLKQGCSFYSLSTRGYKDAGLEDEYRLHDYVFDCQTENGKKALIAICSFEEPLRDYFIKEDSPKISEINGTSLTIYEYKNIYMASFSYQGVNYDVETRNMELKELEELLTGLLSEK